jgi:hypothetical protein
MYYAAINQYSNETSIGFSNTWGVLAFESKEARDRYVNNVRDLATRSITRKQIKDYVSEVKPFSGERYMIGMLPRDIEGCIGEVYVGYENDGQAIRPLS